jgi:hypothetical protein
LPKPERAKRSGRRQGGALRPDDGKPRGKTKMMTVAEFLKWVADKKAKANRDLGEFKNRLEKNPAYAFEWAGLGFEAAAMIEVCSIVENCIDTLSQINNSEEKASEENWFASMKKIALTNSLENSRRPSRSSSPYSNEMSREKAAVWTKVYDRLNNNPFV